MDYSKVVSVPLIHGGRWIRAENTIRYDYDTRPIGLCIPYGFTYEQLLKLVFKKMNVNPVEKNVLLEFITRREMRHPFEIKDDDDVNFLIAECSHMDLKTSLVVTVIDLPQASSQVKEDKVSSAISKKKGNIQGARSSVGILHCDFLLNVLSRLPVISVMQAKLVCRQWRNLIHDPFLIGMHFSYMSENDPCLILHCDLLIRNQLYFVSFSARIDNSGTVKRICVPTMPEFNVVVGSCNGLLCLCDSQYTAVYVYNPITMKYMRLPKLVPVSYQEDVAFGFGFHPTTQVYKIVRIAYYRKKDGGHPYPLLQSNVQIYTLGFSTWRSIGQAPYELLRNPSLRALFNGKLHWLSCRNEELPFPSIVSFDLADEQFRKVPGPTSDFFGTRCSHLLILGGCLSAIVYCSNLRIEIWIMKEYDVKESWIKAFSIGGYLPIGLALDVNPKFYVNPAYPRVLCLLGNGDILLEYKHRALLAYSPKSETFKELLLPGLPKCFESTIHIGSLNWIM